MVQTSLGGQDLDSTEVLWTSAGVMFIMAADDIFKLFSQNNDAAVRVSHTCLLLPDSSSTRMEGHDGGEGGRDVGGARLELERLLAGACVS